MDYVIVEAEGDKIPFGDGGTVNWKLVSKNEETMFKEGEPALLRAPEAATKRLYLVTATIQVHDPNGLHNGLLASIVRESDGYLVATGRNRWMHPVVNLSGLVELVGGDGLKVVAGTPSPFLGQYSRFSLCELGAGMVVK